MRSRPVQRIKDVIRLRARQFAEDGGPLAHPVRPDSYAAIDNLYTATVYEKGAELIRMLKTLIGERAFADGMQLYFNRHDGDATTIETFYQCFEETSGKDLSHFRQWYSQPGTPTVEVSHDYDSWAGKLHLSFKQINPAVPGIAEPKPQVIPIAYAAFSRDGEKLTEDLFILDKAEAEITIPAEAGPPLVSVNRGFSAPIRLDQKISDEDRLALAKIDDDAFNQWDAFQTLLKADLLAMAYEDQTFPNEALITALADAIRGAETDPAFAALLARLPDVNELFQERTPADPVALDAARKKVQRALAENLAEDAARILSVPTPTPFLPDAEQAGKRALRTAMIGLTGALQTSAADARVKAAFDAASNMTESLAALRTLCAGTAPQKHTALEAFESEWSENPLVMDKWFAAQTSTATAAEARALLEHPAFDMGNPNRVRSVAAVFAMQNLAGFHAADGSGYELVADVIRDADKRNPALAARLLTAFESWKALIPETRAKAETVLKGLKG
ncbi:MAG: DUF3458 domain-containing protein, partial [Pseudomonadota bacterium]